MTLRPLISTISSILLSLNLSCQNDVKAFRNSTIANEPTLKVNSGMIISKSKAPTSNDFIAYSFKSEINDEEVRIHKLIAKENDILEIINGIVYVNNVNVDQGRNLMHFYKIPREDYLHIKKRENIADHFYAFPSGKDSINAMLEDVVADNYNWQEKRQIKKSGVADSTIKKMYGKDWNEDNFGPLCLFR